jgi:hypothetical protein
MRRSRFIIRAQARPEAGTTTAQAASVLRQELVMRGIFRGLLAGYGAKKLGGGCISTIIIFLILYWLLGRV